ncbi:MAG: hypothetical protein ACYC8W_07820 [Candidatus Tyrphobacter sp.]
MSDVHKLTAPQMKALQKLADDSDYFASLEAAAKNYGGLSDKQYESFQRSFWKADAQLVDDKPVRNKFKTSDGHARCADRQQPYCTRAAVVVVGPFAFCKMHENQAIDSYNAFRESKAERK